LQRTVQPEILDSLPQEDLGAQKNRRDLLLINRIMGNFSWFSRTLKGHLEPGDHLVEIGAGGGDLGARLAPSFEGMDIRWTALDRWTRPDHWPASWDWIVEDLTRYEAYTNHEAVIGNLILHQFEDEQLLELGKIWDRHARLLIFNEPARQRLPLLLMKASILIGMHPISRHDAAVSIRAGFLGEELPYLLGLNPDRWAWNLSTTVTGGYRMAAWRNNL
jgi:hypothetical protein